MGQIFSQAADERKSSTFDAPALAPEDVKRSLRQIGKYLRPYKFLMNRMEQERNLGQMIEGLTSNLERKSVEPIAVMHGRPRRALQRFVGEAGWSHEPLRDQLTWEVSEEIGIQDGTVVIDGSATPKKGIHTVGVDRQWCGAMGKTESCVIGVYGVYVGKSELSTLVAAELFLPKDWTSDLARRVAAYVPPEIEYRTQPEIAAKIVAQLAATDLPFKWVLADDEFGRKRAFRDGIAAMGKSYLLDVPKDTVVRRCKSSGQISNNKIRADRLVARAPNSDWSTFHVRDGEKQPIDVRAIAIPVATHRDDGSSVRETLLAIETLDGSEHWYCLARSGQDVGLFELVRRAGMRHRVEEVFQQAKGEVGLDHFEVRAWHGWYHHMTLCQMAHWFLVREKRRLGKKRNAAHAQPDPNGDRPALRAHAYAEGIDSDRQLPCPAQP